ncbi:MAG: hypothetical protein ACK40Q_02330 [Pseudothermotoga sp.]
MEEVLSHEMPHLDYRTILLKKNCLRYVPAALTPPYQCLFLLQAGIAFYKGNRQCYNQVANNKRMG